MLQVEAFEGGDFLEGAQTLRGSLTRFCCHLEKFRSVQFYSVDLRSDFYSVDLRSDFYTFRCTVRPKAVSAAVVPATHANAVGELSAYG